MFPSRFLPICVLACAQLLVAANADLILHNGKIVTVDESFSIKQAVAIAAGRITVAGDSTAILSSGRGPETTVIDLKGKTVLPGLIDSHVHPYDAALSELREPLPHLTSFADIKNYIRQKAGSTPKGKWIVVPRTFPTRLKEMRMPTREVLDAVTDHPVMFDASYVVVVNTAGLRLSGINRDTPNPPRGEIVKDANGEPNGILRNAQSLLKGLQVTGGYSFQEKLDALERMLRKYVEAGLTSIGDGAVTEAEIPLYRKLRSQNRLPLRAAITWWLDISNPAGELSKQIGAAHYKTNEGDDWLRWGAFKVNIDGGMTIGTAYQRRPYGPFGRQLYALTDPGSRGQLFAIFDKFVEVLRTARDKGWQLASHCQGGGAIDVFLNVLDKLNGERPIAPTRPHVIHASFQSPESIQLMKRLGVLADVQPAWLYLDATALEKVFSYEGMRYFFPLRSYLDAGIVVAGGSDHMIGYDKSSAINPYNPFLGMWTCVTRKTKEGRVIHPEERVIREEALKMYTIWAAYRQFGEKTKGSIEPGKLADMVVIDRDYMTCPEDEIQSIEPVMTIIDGKIVYRKPGN